MKSNAKFVSEQEEEKFSLPSYLKHCLARWKWFAGTFIVLVGLAVLYLQFQEPMYQRTMTVMITQQDQGNSVDMSQTFADMGLVSTRTKVNNELIAIQSPAVVTEVVKRLDLQTNYDLKKGLHPNVLYGSDNPVTVIFPDLDNNSTASISLKLNPDGSFEISNFKRTRNGIVTEDDSKIIKGRVGFNTIETPIGRVMVQPNGRYVAPAEAGTEEIEVSRSTLAQTVSRYTGKLKASLVDPDSDVINILIDDPSVERATDILEETLEAYNEFWITDRNKLARATTEFINTRLASLQQELGEVDHDISSYKSEVKVPDLGHAAQVYLDKSLRISDDMIQINNSLSMVNYLRDFIGNPANALKLIPAIGGLTGLEGLSTQINQYNELLLQRDNLIGNSSESNPIVNSLDHRLKGKREAVMTSVENLSKSLSHQLDNINKLSAHTESELSANPGQANVLLSAERQQKVKEELYLYLLQKREETELSQTFTASNTRVVTPPYGSSVPISPNKKLIVILAAIIGLGIPAAWIYVLEATNTRVRTKSEVEHLRIPYLGEIAHVNRYSLFQRILMGLKIRKESSGAPLVVVKKGLRDVVNESFKVVRSNLDFMIGKDKTRSVAMITSFNPGSGKSFITYNLGACYALKGRRVLVVDADLRHGSLSSYVDSPKKGLTDYLTDPAEGWEGFVVESKDFPGLNVMPIGHRPPNPAELLEDGAFVTLIEKARERYDIVLIDCPPLNIVVDTHVIAPLVDRSIFVIRSGLFERKDIREIESIYDEEKLKNMCLLLNGTDSSASYYNSRGYYHYYVK